MRALAVALALLCAGCANLWTYDERDYFADLARYAPAAGAPAALAGTPAAPGVQVGAPVPAAALPAPLSIEEPLEMDFACADGARLRIAYSPDRQTAVAHWSDGVDVALSRDDHEGVIRYVSQDASFFRAGPRIAWEGPGEYEVRPGDTLWKISERFYSGDRGRGLEIAALNTDRIADPNLIYPGQRLRIPGAQRRLCSRPLSAQVM